MKWMRRKTVPLALLATVLVGTTAFLRQQLPKRAVDDASLETAFRTAADTIQTGAYWYWMSGNISKEGVVKDLQAMKRVGINRAYIGMIGYAAVPYGNVKLFSDEWWDILHTALKTATELDIEIGLFNSPGWSQSGGPWVKPENAMRYLASAEILVTGGKLFDGKLPKPADDFQDVKVVAFKAPEGYLKNIAQTNPRLTASGDLKNTAALLDGELKTAVALPTKEPLTIDIETPSAFTARSLVLHPDHKPMQADVQLQVRKTDGSYQTVKTFTIDRRNDNLNVGFNPYGPAVVSIPAITATHFRLIFSKGSPNFGLTEIQLLASPRVESYVEKTLAKMHPTPYPYWKEYQWPSQPAVTDTKLVIDPATVRDISKHLSPDGTLRWQVPPGNWVVIRTGMVPTGVRNAQAPPEGSGLEVDKMSRKHLEMNFDSFFGEIIRRIPAQDRKTWRMTVADSYETGGQNWTDNQLQQFKNAFGYDALPYLPVLSGQVVGSPEMADRFLWDLRRFIADRVAYEYVGGLRDISHKHGLRTWLENYGHWGFPGEFLQYGGQSDEIAGEFWSEGELGNIENRAASSAAHIYGKKKVSSESFTAGGRPYYRYPAVIKQRGDRFFTEGINSTLLHVFIHQPTDARLPGINADFSTEFNRHNTWFNYLDLFIAYLKRCNLMLQQGRYVADVAYFIGEDAPKMIGITDPALPPGHSYDYINAEVIKNRLQVKDGRLTLPDGLSYRVLVLPKLETIRPDVLAKIRELVQNGATILGPAPNRSPSLQNYPTADRQVQKMARELWGNANGSTVKSHRFGKGMVLTGMDMNEALRTLNTPPDFRAEGVDSVLYIHRSLPQGELYFVSNQSHQTLQLTPEFRVLGKQPELWDPVAGTIRPLPQFTQTATHTRVPLQLETLQSAFILFRKTANQAAGTGQNFPAPQLVSTIRTPWQVQFDANLRGPQEPVTFTTLTDWTQRPEETIRYYSGTAVYRNTFTVEKPQAGTRMYLHLGDLTAMARVRVNGKDVGGVWTAPWQVDIAPAVKSGENTLEIQVVNTWVNRLIGDSKLPAEQRKTWTNVNPFKPDSKLHASGLRGPVTIRMVK
ncbi:hypothetical protein GCM10027347_29880 [Larkinella harenae]